MVRRGPKRSVLCAQSEELHQKRACLESDARYGVGKFERGGGVRIFGRGVREKGGSDEPPEPPLVTGLSIPRKEIWRSSRERNVPEKYIRLVQDMYQGCKTVVCSTAGESNSIGVEV